MRTRYMESYSEYARRTSRARRARAQYVNRCRMAVACVIAAVVICIVFGVAVLRSNASGSDHIGSYKYYKSIVVSYHYDLYDAAAEYADDHYDSERAYLREVCSINHLGSVSDVTPGTQVIVPYYDEEYY